MIGQILRNVFFGRGKNQTTVSLDSVLESADSHLKNFDDLFPPSPQSKPRTSFNPDIPPREMSMMNLTLRQKLRIAPKAVPLMYNMKKGAQMYDGKLRATRHEATAAFIAELEQLAYQMGVKSIGYVKVPSYAIFQDKGLPCAHAIVFTVEMEKEPIETAPSFECQLEVVKGYKNMAAISKKLAKHLRRHGYDAYPGTALGGITDYPHLAELAGLGAIGYHGLLIGPDAGARVRINTIYTNISNLPTLEAQERENEHLWVRDFCAMCRKCPVQAIYDEPVPRGDGGMQTIEHATCRDYFAANFGCGVCLAVCPFSHTGYEQIKAKFKGNPQAPQFRIPVEG